jgi:hypothetical protein
MVGPWNWFGHLEVKNLLSLPEFKVLPVAGHYTECAVPAVACQVVQLVVLYWAWCCGYIAWFICEHFPTYLLQGVTVIVVLLNFWNFSYFLWSKMHFYGDFFICDLILVAKPFVRFSQNSVLEIFIKSCWRSPGSMQICSVTAIFT